MSEQNLTTIELDLIQTTAAALAVLFLGFLLNRLIPLLRNCNIPEPVVGGIAYATVSSVLHSQIGLSISFDMTLKTPLMLVFFTTVGLGASLKLLVRGGPKVLLFLAVATLYLLVQNGTSVAMARLFDLHPLQGMLSGSVTLSGGTGPGRPTPRSSPRSTTCRAPWSWPWPAPRSGWCWAD